jgi:hypothetical protein
VFKAKPGQIVWETPISKMTRVKWTGGVAQVVQCLFGKTKTLSSNPSYMKRKRKKWICQTNPWLLLPGWSLVVHPRKS